MVIIRYSAAGSRHALNSNARRFGNLVSRYREMAVTQEMLFALRLDKETARYDIVSPVEKSADGVALAEPLAAGNFDSSVVVTGIQVAGRPVQDPVVLFFESRSVMPEVELILVHSSGDFITIRLDPIINEVFYE
jgi:hypothetical protein